MIDILCEVTGKSAVRRKNLKCFESQNFPVAITSWTKEDIPPPGIEPGSGRFNAFVMRAADASHYTMADLLFIFQSMTSLTI